MKLYYKYDKYRCSIGFDKKNTNTNVLIVYMPLKDYLKITSDIRDCSKEFHFRLLANKNENSDFVKGDGLWSIDSKVLNGLVDSKSTDGNFKIIFKINITSMVRCSEKEKNKSIIDDIFIK